MEKWTRRGCRASTSTKQLYLNHGKLSCFPVLLPPHLPSTGPQASTYLKETRRDGASGHPIVGGNAPEHRTGGSCCTLWRQNREVSGKHPTTQRVSGPCPEQTLPPQKPLSRKSSAQALVTGQGMGSRGPRCFFSKMGGRQGPVSTFRHTRGVMEWGKSKSTPVVSGRVVTGRQHSVYCGTIPCLSTSCSKRQRDQFINSGSLSKLLTC